MGHRTSPKNSVHPVGATRQDEESLLGNAEGAKWRAHRRPGALPCSALLPFNLLILLACGAFVLRAVLPAPCSDPFTATFCTTTERGEGLAAATGIMAWRWPSDSNERQGTGLGGALSHELAKLLHPVCWRSTEHGGYQPKEEERRTKQGMPGVSVFGSGCSFCMVRNHQIPCEQVRTVCVQH